MPATSASASMTASGFSGSELLELFQRAGAQFGAHAGGVEFGQL